MVKRYRQRGAVLIFSLLLLLVLTVLGTSGVGNSLLEERMSNNFFQTYSAMQAAETALRVAENWLSSEVESANMLSPGDNNYKAANDWFSNSSGNRPGLYSTQTAPGVYATCQGLSSADCVFAPTNESHWCNPMCNNPSAQVITNELPKGSVELGTNDLGTGDLLAIDGDLVSQQPRFIIEYLGRGMGREPNMVMGGAARAPDARKHAFRITAIGWGRDSTSRYVLQSHFQL